MFGIIFDLDNTLYDARQYFESAFAEISEYLSGKYNVNKKAIYNKLLELWKEKTSMYPRLFDDFLESVKLDESITELIRIFDNCQINLRTYQDVPYILKELKNRGYKLGILTDGKTFRQNRKIDSLGIRNFFDEIVISDELGYRKPSVVPYKYILERLGVEPYYSIYVGDNPLIDFKGAKKIGMYTVRILRGEFKHIENNTFIDWNIDKFKELIEIIESIKTAIK